MRGIVLRARRCFTYRFGLALLLIGLGLGLAPPLALAANPIQTENALPGDWEWYIDGPLATNGEIEGYTNLPSYNRGETITFYISTTSPKYKITIFRVGWYDGVGGRAVTTTVTRTGGIKQAVPAPNATTGLVDAGWKASYTLKVPTTWTSGFYLAKLETVTGGYQRYIPFVVRNDASTSTYLFQSPANTWQAYNSWGGKSLYSYNSTNGIPASKVSFNRPYDVDGSGALFSWEINMAHFLEREGYDVTYATNYETDNNPNLLLNHKAFLSVGHDEYWTWKMRQNVEAARAKGIHLGFFGSNDCYWQIRYEASPVNGAARRTIVAYKYDALTKDPYALDTNKSNDKYITTTWRDAPVNLPEEALIGVMYHGDPVDGNIVVADASHWIYNGTGLSNGDVLPGLLGYETDASFGKAPAGTQVIAHSPDPFGYADMSVYTWQPSGAVVFAAGSLQFTWGLDSWWEGLEHPAVQTMTRNILARFAGPAQ